MKNKIKIFLSLFLSIWFMLSPIININTIYADDKSKITKALDKSDGKFGSTEDSLNTLYKNGGTYEKGDREGIDYVMYRVLRSNYMQTVDKATLADNDDEENDGAFFYDPMEVGATAISGIRLDPTTICDIDREQGNYDSKKDPENKAIKGWNKNYLYHNCDIPTVLVEMQQNFYDSAGSTPILNAEVTTAFEKNGLGIPASIPGDGLIPIDLDTTTEKYTGLELYGYNLPVTSYVGEWDKIQVNTEARLLANFGILDTVALGLNSVTEGFKGVVKNIFTGFSFNPIKWATRIINGAGNGLIPILDSSDANVAAKRAWNRSSFAGTTYNGIHYLSNKMVSQKSLMKYKEFIEQTLEGKIKDYPELQNLFKYDFDKSKDKRPGKIKNSKARKAASAEISKYNKKVKDCKKDKECIVNLGKRPSMPKLEKYTELEELEEYYSLNKNFFSGASSAGVEIPEIGEGDGQVATVQDFIKTYKDNYVKKVSDTFENGGKEIEKINKDMEEDFLGSNPQFNPEREVSHWVCLDPQIKYPSVSELVEAPYLFLAGGVDKSVNWFSATSPRDRGTDEHLGVFNTECSNFKTKYGDPIGPEKLRPTVKGGLLGSGAQPHDGVRDENMDEQPLHDTRWQLHNRLRTKGSTLNKGDAKFRKSSVVLVKSTNTLIGFSFNNILKSLGLDEVMEAMIVSLRDGMYYPLITLAFAITAFWMFFSFAKNGFAARQFFQTGGMLILTTILVMAFMNKPIKSIELLDKLPTEIDNVIINSLTQKSEGQDSTCVINDDGNQIRALQCEVWRVGVLNPWLANQWGVTDITMLDHGNMKGSKRPLIGQADVKMGGGYIKNNWALYQLDLMKSGNITQEDPNRLSDGKLDRDMYRIVDLQYGPNYGEGTDDRFAAQWSGENRQSTYGFLGLVSSFLMLIVLGKFAIYKIQISLSLTLNYMLTPFMGLIGAMPGGVQKLRDFFSHILGLMLRRSIITLMMTITITFVTAGASLGMGLASYYMYIIVVLFSINHFWKQISDGIGKVGKTPLQMGGSGTGGQIMGGQYVEANEIADSLERNKVLPKSIRQNIATRKMEMQETASGVIAGAALSAKYRSARKDGTIVSKYKEYARDEDGKLKRDENGRFIVVENTRNATTFDMIRQQTESGRRRARNRSFAMHRREGFGFYKQMQIPILTVKEELANEISKGGNTADIMAVKNGYDLLLQKGIISNKNELQNDLNYQRHIRNYSYLREELELLSKKKGKNAKEIKEINDRMYEILQNMEKEELYLQKKNKLDKVPNDTFKEFIKKHKTVESLLNDSEFVAKIKNSSEALNKLALTQELDSNIQTVYETQQTIEYKEKINEANTKFNQIIEEMHNNEVKMNEAINKSDMYETWADFDKMPDGTYDYKIDEEQEEINKRIDSRIEEIKRKLSEDDNLSQIYKDYDDLNDVNVDISNVDPFDARRIMFEDEVLDRKLTEQEVDEILTEVFGSFKPVIDMLSDEYNQNLNVPTDVDRLASDIDEYVNNVYNDLKYDESEPDYKNKNEILKENIYNEAINKYKIENNKKYNQRFNTDYRTEQDWKNSKPESAYDERKFNPKYSEYSYKNVTGAKTTSENSKEMNERVENQNSKFNDNTISGKIDKIKSYTFKNTNSGYKKIENKHRGKVDEDEENKE